MNTKLPAWLFPTLLMFALILGSCKQKDETGPIVQGMPRPVLRADRLPSQVFSIRTDRDTVIKGSSGTKLHIHRNSFVDGERKPATGEIQLELREALTPAQIILSGLTTTTQGKYLETGGMIQVQVTGNGQRLDLAAGKSIEVMVPADTRKDGMQLYCGEPDSMGINWTDPVPLWRGASDTLARVPDEKEPEQVVKGLDTGMLRNGISDAAIPERQGINFFKVDARSGYVFTLKNLGWANIDQLDDDPRTRQVEFVTKVDNKAEFNLVTITLIVGEKGMYIPGYQRADGTYSFTHNDEEPPMLPVGAKATILATAYKGETPYFSMTSLTISEKQQVVLKLEGTTENKLKDELMKRL